MFKSIKSNLHLTLVVIAALIYTLYFSLFTINRFEKMYAHYFDLGIMHHATYNTYKALQTGDFTRILEHTNPHDTVEQVKRMSIHNDVILAFIAPLFFIHDGPATLLILQTIILASGSIFVYLIAVEVLKKYSLHRWVAFILSFAYLMYAPMQKANAFDFHAVTFTTSFLLAVYYFWLKRQYLWSFFFILLSLLTKEQVGMTTALFGGFVLVTDYEQSVHKPYTVSAFISYLKELPSSMRKKPNLVFSFFVMVISVVWVLLSMKVIIPYFRGEEHFASDYYDHITEAPWAIPSYIFREQTYEFIHAMLGPLGYVSLLAPFHFLISLPDLAIILLSSNDNMRNTYFHYESVVTPFVFISAIYGISYLFKLSKKMNPQSNEKSITLQMIVILLITSLYYSYQHSTLPYAKNADTYPWRGPAGRYEDMIIWKKKLDRDDITVSTTGRIAPHFTARRYYYEFTWKYPMADYVVIEENDAIHGYRKKYSLPAYKLIQNDKKYIKIYDRNGIEVYQRISNSQ